jgi:hypothetical protein
MVDLLRVLRSDRTPRTEEEQDALYYLRVTILVAVALVVGALLEWIPSEPSTWRWLPLGVVYLAGGKRIIQDSCDRCGRRGQPARGCRPDLPFQPVEGA